MIIHGKKAVEAPIKIKKITGWIFGYNSPANEQMLVKDGYIKYTGNLPISCLTYEDGKIIENMPEIVQPAVQPQIYTKLQIRRALRKLKKESILDKMLLSRNSTFAKDWNDAQEINLDDEIFKAALQALQISEDDFREVLNVIGE